MEVLLQTLTCCCRIDRKIFKKRKSLNAISLNENISTITALSNDFNYKYVFSRQLEGLGKEEMYYLQFQHQVKVKIF